MRKNIKLRVKNLVNKYQTADPFALAKELDVNILYVPLPEKIRGILVRVLRKKTILLNDKLNYEAQKIVICHELGHVRMHWHAGYFFQQIALTLNSFEYLVIKKLHLQKLFCVQLLGCSSLFKLKNNINFI